MKRSMAARWRRSSPKEKPLPMGEVSKASSGITAATRRVRPRTFSK
jgi:hypothetical protein